MRVWLAGTICIAVAWTGIVAAAPAGSPAESYRSPSHVYQPRDYQQALEGIDHGLTSAPRNLDLLFLRASTLYALRDLTGAIAAYKACIKAGAKGRNRDEALSMIRELEKAQPTAIDIAVTNGPAT